MAGSEPMTPGEILAKVEWEGGWPEVIGSWGLKPEHSDDPNISMLIRNARDYWEAFDRSCEELDAALAAAVGPEVRDEC